MAASSGNNPLHVHATAIALGFLSAFPIPNAPGEKLKDVSWLSYGVFTEQVKDGTGFFENLKPSTDNYIGAATFVAYIVVAMYLSLRVFGRLGQAASNIPESQASQRLSIFSSMAFLGFVIQGVNMSLFLVDSFLKWKKNPVVQVKLISSPGLFYELQQWMTASTLFVDFAKSLYQTRGGYWWACQGLSASMISSLYITAIGKLYKIPKLLDYIILAQIMPVSFTLNLFFVAVLIERFKKPEKPKTTELLPGLLPSWAAWPCLAAFRGLLAYLPVLVSNYDQTIPAIVATRLLIFLVYLVTPESPLTLDAALPWTLLYRLVFSASTAVSLSTISSLASSISVNFAVNTLGMDFVIWLTSILMWRVTEFLL